MCHLAPVTAKQAELLEWVVLLGLPGLAVFHHSAPVYLESGIWCFTGLLISGFICSITLALLPRLCSRPRPTNTAPPHYLKELWCSLKNVFVISFIAAWPVANHRLGFDTSLKWRLEDTGDTLPQALLKIVMAFFAGDAFFYWQHRLFHRRELYIFHKLHHSFQNPSPFAIFAVHPVETFTLYFPIWTHSLPELNQWAPPYLAFFGFLAIFIMYIHSDTEMPPVDRFFGALGFITPNDHNLHHKRSKVNYGGLTCLWDWLCQTGHFSRPASS